MRRDVDVDFDVVVVGGGVAGCVAAIQLARAGKEVALIERGMEPGTKNLSGGVFYCRVMEKVFPDFINVAPVERQITRNVLSFLNKDSHVNIDYADARLEGNAVSVLRAKLDLWLSEQAEEAGVMVMPGVRVDKLLIENDQICGVVAGEDTVRSHIVIAADGVNSFLAQEAGIRAKEPMKHLAVGVKSVISLPEAAMKERFGGKGTAYAVVGEATQGVAGGGFLSTNADSVSVGVVLRLDDLAAKGLVASQIHDQFLANTAIAPLLEGGELLEYGSHMTIEDGPAMTAHDLTRPGLMIIGDAAGFTLNTGMTIRGMDLAAESAICAARAAAAALDANDFSQSSMELYPSEVQRSWLGKDMTTYAKAPAFFEISRLYEDYGPLLADVFYGLYNLDLTPRQHMAKSARGALKKSGIKMRTLARDAMAALRAL